MCMVRGRYYLKWMHVACDTHCRFNMGCTLTLYKRVTKMAASSVPDHQLNVEELNVTSAVLMGAAHHYGAHCKKQNEAFMDCRIESKDPRKCLREGREVTQCALSFFKKIKSSCNEEFTNYWSCLDYNNQDFTRCRRPQSTYDRCMSEKLNIERPKPEDY